MCVERYKFSLSLMHFAGLCCNNKGILNLIRGLQVLYRFGNCTSNLNWQKNCVNLFVSLAYQIDKINSLNRNQGERSVPLSVDFIRLRSYQVKVIL